MGVHKVNLGPINYNFAFRFAWVSQLALALGIAWFLIFEFILPFLFRIDFPSSDLLIPALPLLYMGCLYCAHFVFRCPTCKHSMFKEKGYGFLETSPYPRKICDFCGRNNGVGR